MTEPTLERRIISLLLQYETVSQAEIASQLNATPTAIQKALLAAEKSGLIELSRQGRTFVPRLRLFTALETLEAAVRKLRCTPALSKGAA